MSTSGGDHTTLSVRALLIALVGWGIVMARIVLVIWVGTVASADAQLVRTANPSDMIGKVVKDREGRVLGRIHDVVFHWRSDAYTEYAVLSCGGWWGVGEGHVAVPGEALTPNTRKNHFVLNMDKGQLNEAPDFVVYRLYDRSFADVLGGDRSMAASAAHAMMDTIASTEAAWGRGALGIQPAVETEFNR